MEQINKSIGKYMYAKNAIKSSNIEIKVLSDCMVPLIDTGDLVEITACNDYHRGDIVAVFIKNQIYLHRIIKVKSDTVITKGDRTFNTDPEVNKEYIIGLLDKNLSKKVRILRRKFITAMIAHVSGFEAKLFLRMENDVNHKKLKVIYRMRKVVDFLNEFCIDRTEHLNIKNQH